MTILLRDLTDPTAHIRHSISYFTNAPYLPAPFGRIRVLIQKPHSLNALFRPQLFNLTRSCKIRSLQRSAIFLHQLFRYFATRLFSISLRTLFQMVFPFGLAKKCLYRRFFVRYGRPGCTICYSPSEYCPHPLIRSVRRVVLFNTVNDFKCPFSRVHSMGSSESIGNTADCQQRPLACCLKQARSAIRLR